jgi:hypothetical protein
LNETTLSDEAEELLEGEAIPEFRWLRITGHPGAEDFGQTAQARLVGVRGAARVSAAIRIPPRTNSPVPCPP